MRSLLVVLALLPSLARAEDVALSVNAPTSWAATSFGGSIFFAPAAHHAVRLNAASYPYGPNAVLDLLTTVAFQAENEGEFSGRTHDVGASYILFPRAFCDGPMIEAGALLRLRDTRSFDPFASPALLATDTKTFAARAMVGWSWRVGGSGFISLAVGASWGVERGSETTGSDLDTNEMTADVRRRSFEGEGILRIGALFDHDGR